MTLEHMPIEEIPQIKEKPKPMALRDYLPYLAVLLTLLFTYSLWSFAISYQNTPYIQNKYCNASTWQNYSHSAAEQGYVFSHPLGGNVSSFILYLCSPASKPKVPSLNNLSTGVWVNNTTKAS